MVNLFRLALLLLLMAGCGLKGPLSLPDANPPPQKDQKK
jgi:predicted small lipoprotein YifL